MKPQTFSLSTPFRRFTSRRYWRDFYGHSAFIGSFDVIESAQGKTDDYGSGTNYLRVMVDSTARTANVIRALEDCLSSQCHCEHDCCGHIQRNVSAVLPIPVSEGEKREFVVMQSFYRNI